MTKNFEDSPFFNRIIHLTVMALSWALLIIAAYTMVTTAAYAVNEILLKASSDNIMEGTIIRALGTIILIEVIFVVRKLDEKHHLNIGLALDVAATFLIREAVLAVYAKDGMNTMFLLLASITVMVLLRVAYSFKKQKEYSDG